MKQIDIFYADDDEDDLMFFNEAIEQLSNDSKNHIKLHIHKNGEQLIESIKEHRDKEVVVFLDINMPLKSGFELLEQIRTEPEIKHFPVIIYSTSSNEDFINKSRELGANFYAVKPYKFGSLVKMLSTFTHFNWKDYVLDIHTFLYK